MADDDMNNNYPWSEDNWFDREDEMFRVMDFDGEMKPADKMLKRMKQVAKRMNRERMHDDYQAYLEACDDENPPAEPEWCYFNEVAWLSSNVGSMYEYCDEYRVPYHLFERFQELYIEIYSSDPKLKDKLNY